MRIKDELETIELLKEGNSICRYGDGEGKILLGKSAPDQVFTKDIAIKLGRILKTKEKILIGIPWFDTRWFEKSYNVDHIKNFSEWHRYYLPFLDYKKTYYSAFITRPDTVIHLLNKEYWKAWKSLWENKQVIYIFGNVNLSGLDTDLFNNSKSIKLYKVAPRDTYDSLVKMKYYTKLEKIDRNIIILIAAGPAATVWAHDISIMGFQTLDIGHLGRFYKLYQQGWRGEDLKEYEKNNKRN